MNSNFFTFSFLLLFLAGFNADANPKTTTWKGPTGQESDWNLSENWDNGIPTLNGYDNVTINNGGTATLTQSTNFVGYLTMIKGGLKIGEKGNLSNRYRVAPGVEEGKPEFLLSLTDGGNLTYINKDNIFWGHPDGTRFKVLVSGEGSLINAIDTSIHLQNGEVVIDGGSIRLPSPSGWLYVAHGEKADGLLTITNGTLELEALVVSRDTSTERAELIVKKDGHISVNGSRGLIAEWSNAAVPCTNRKVEIRLENGSVLTANQIRSQATQNSPVALYIDGGKLQLTGSTGINFPDPSSRVWIQKNGLLIENSRNITMSQPLFEDPDSPGGGITKSGTGSLVLIGTNNLTGDFVCQKGWFELNQETGQFGGRIIIQNPGKFTINTANRFTFTGSLIGDSILAKTGSGELLLNGDVSQFEGEFKIYEGRMTISTNTQFTISLNRSSGREKCFKWAPTASGNQTLASRIQGNTAYAETETVEAQSPDKDSVLTMDLSSFSGYLGLYPDTRLALTAGENQSLQGLKVYGTSTLDLAGKKLQISVLQTKREGALTIQNGILSVPEGTLTIKIPRPIKKGYTPVLHIDEETWEDGQKPNVSLQDETGAPIEPREAHSYYNGRTLWITTIYGSLIILN